MPEPGSPGRTGPVGGEPIRHRLGLCWPDFAAGLGVLVLAGVVVWQTLSIPVSRLVAKQIAWQNAYRADCDPR